MAHSFILPVGKRIYNAYKPGRSFQKIGHRIRHYCPARVRLASVLRVKK